MEEENSIALTEPAHFSYKKYTNDIYPIVIDTLSIPGVIIETGDELGVFTSDDICCGARPLTNGQSGLVLTAWADDIATSVKDGFEWDEDMVFKFYDASLDTEYVIDESVFSTVSSADPLAEPVVAAFTGGFGTGQYGVRALRFAGPGYAVPNHYALHQNYPNPFNPSTVIRFDLPQASKVKLEVFNILGQRVIILADEIMTAGYRQITWNGENAASGIYIYRLQAEAVEGSSRYSSMKKMIMVK